ncbi:Alpha/Beta hydrolase protein [Microdochium trichocladiopsis]|uniref:Carboxylic ester hydrolase n=1 Tax=Microdochium trichocladiopsis TaxID=1682393 RepID=A0A9P8XVR8_9PEZI|nr:Alpha/Beta hydrolase protein [Microdochium trichocladiopsis]KAH7021436.1 Alpha/Beta hydrolase protein [Microdochium trichocladiopsis]
MTTWLLLAAQSIFTAAAAEPTAINQALDVTYHGLERNGIELFLNIPYGLDTGGEHRFKPPRPAVPLPGSTVEATNYGPSCPQSLGTSSPPLAQGNITQVSEDCLNLNVARPKGTTAKDKLPVLVWIHGGSFWAGSNAEPTTRPDGLILESVANGIPVMHVAMNYRLGFFGFAQSDALQQEGSENAGLRDQRLAIEWVRDNIGHFGGDGRRITIFGQSSGGLAVGMQIMAYGGTQPVPFQQGICESQALEPGITANFTIDAMQLLVDAVACNTSALHSPETVACLRSLDTETLRLAAIDTYIADIAHNIGDIWLPVVDGDFLPAAPSVLAKEHRFATDVTTMIGWADSDVAFYTDSSIATPQDTHKFIADYIPYVTPANIDTLLGLYPVGEFAADAARSQGTLSAEFFRSARIFRDIIMACQPVWFGGKVAAAADPGTKVYLYDWNQTVLEPALDFLSNKTGWGPVHTSEFAYIFGNVSVYDVPGFPFTATPADYALQSRGSRSWSTFAATGKPGGLCGKDTFQGFDQAFPQGEDGETYVFVVGGADEGLSAFDGPRASEAIAAQRLTERCAFINSDEMIEQLRY